MSNKLKPFDMIVDQLAAQSIHFKIVQAKFEGVTNNPVAIIRDKWKHKFIANRNAPNLDAYLWHIFSSGAMFAIDGNEARKALLSQWPSDVFIFNEGMQYLIECYECIPNIVMDEFNDDVYISHHNMKWTFVLTHEDPDFGPYFSN